MKCLGLIGGMSWESTLLYYRHINRMVSERLGGLHSAELVMHSFDFARVAALQSAGQWDIAADMLADAAIGLKCAGAKALIICTNTMHKVADAVEAKSGLPLLHIADAAAAEIRPRSLKRLGLLATCFTMEDDFYKERLARHGLEVIIPPSEARTEIHRIIFEELCRGRIKAESRQFYQETVDRLQHQGAEGIILGCTEIGLLLQQEETTVPLFDTAYIHAKAAVDWMLEEKENT